MQRILITGGSGLIGRNLAGILIKKGYEVSVLSRRKSENPGLRTYIWDIDKAYIEEGAVEEANYIIHLAGTFLAEKRWSAAQKKQIRDSRIRSAELLFEKTKKLNPGLNAFISASAIGYYGAVTSDRIFVETDLPGKDFLAETCRLWEQSANQFQNLGIRNVIFRNGVVLAKGAAVSSRLIMPVKLGVGSAIGNGKQYLPWIHMDDLCNLYLKAIEDESMSGIYNAVAPAFNSTAEVTGTLASLLHMPFWPVRVPSFMIKLIFGEMASMVTEGSRVSPEKLLGIGFKFKYSAIEEALKDILN